MIKYFSQYIQPSVGLICHFTHYKAISGSDVVTKNKTQIMRVQNKSFLNVFKHEPR